MKGRRKEREMAGERKGREGMEGEGRGWRRNGEVKGEPERGRKEREGNDKGGMGKEEHKEEEE